MNKTLKVPRRVKSQQLKEKIFAAAQKLLVEKGYEYLTVNNVCLTAGVSAGSFYHHFESKDELLAYYFVAGHEKYQKQFDAITGNDVIKNIVGAYALYIAFCQEQSIGFMKIFYTPANKSLRVNLTPDGSISRAIPVVVKSVEIIEKAQAGGYLDKNVSARRLGSDLCTLIKGCIFDWCLNDGNIDLPDLARRLLGGYLERVVTEKYRKEFSVKKATSST